MKQKTKANYLLVFVVVFTVIIFFVILFNASKQSNQQRDQLNNQEDNKNNGPQNFKLEILIENLDTPWAIDFLPDGRMIFTERPGRVNVYDIDKNELKIIGNIDVSEVSESGLMGIAVDPEFVSNKYIYAYYTANSGNRVSRFVLDSDRLENEEILLDNIPNAIFHDGGRIKFGRDGKLYVTTGDATNPSSAQDINSLAGKILRMNKDGTIPEDNPFRNYVYSYGHRNPQGLAWHSNGELYSSEHGPTRNDEINIIEKGGNYGWPKECTDSGNFKNPIRCFTEFTLAPSGIAFYNNDLYVAGLRGSQLRRVVFDENGNIIHEEAFFSELGRIREVAAHGNYLYVATSNRDGRGSPREGDDKIIRISYKI